MSVFDLKDPDKFAMDTVGELAAMSTAEGPRKWELEKAAMAEAYTSQLKELFHDYNAKTATDVEALGHFKQSVATLRRAYVHAVSVFSDMDSI